MNRIARSLAARRDAREGDDGRMNRTWWALAVALMGFGWLTFDTLPGMVLLLLGTGLAVGLLARHRTPAGLFAFSIVMLLGWWVFLVSFPPAFAVPLSTLAIAAIWRRRTTTPKPAPPTVIPPRD